MTVWVGGGEGLGGSWDELLVFRVVLLPLDLLHWALRHGRWFLLFTLLRRGKPRDHAGGGRVRTARASLAAVARAAAAIPVGASPTGGGGRLGAGRRLSGAARPGVEAGGSGVGRGRVRGGGEGGGDAAAGEAGHRPRLGRRAARRPAGGPQPRNRTRC